MEEGGGSGGSISDAGGGSCCSDQATAVFAAPVEFKSLDFCDPCTKAWTECLVSFIPIVGDAYGCAEPLAVAPSKRFVL